MNNQLDLETLILATLIEKTIGVPLETAKKNTRYVRTLASQFGVTSQKILEAIDLLEYKSDLSEPRDAVP
jgi:hypothetical protein